MKLDREFLQVRVTEKQSTFFWGGNVQKNIKAKIENRSSPPPVPLLSIFNVSQIFNGIKGFTLFRTTSKQEVHCDSTLGRTIA